MKSESRLVNYYLDRVKKQLNCMTLVIGDCGSGKSYTTLTLGEELSKITGRPFSAKNNCFFDAISFLRAIRDPDRKAGDVLIFEEVGALLGNRDWYTENNKLITSTFEVFRKKKLIVFLTVPHRSSLDKRALKLMNLIIRTDSKMVNHAKGFNRVRAYTVRYNPMDKSDERFYSEFLRVRDKSNNIYAVTKAKIHLPSLSIRREYEKMKDEFIDQFIDDAINTLDNPMDKVKTLSARESQVIPHFVDGYANNIPERDIVAKVVKTLKLPSTAIREYRDRAVAKGFLVRPKPTTTTESIP